MRSTKRDASKRELNNSFLFAEETSLPRGGLPPILAVQCHKENYFFLTQKEWKTEALRERDSEIIQQKWGAGKEGKNETAKR